MQQWTENSRYHQRSLVETAMYRYKQLLSGKVTLREYNGQISEILANGFKRFQGYIEQQRPFELINQGVVHEGLEWC
ncbi:hypothetical protein [Vibrio sp. Isolate30]|uniref:hypothetical protein n=1 Tax=Vibrio sp. Isolate30 TaxID=2908536 RepID=UPI001EFD975D|nr:hypothetical protein [Vibrio sp. Isolate30]MCG9631699.1 hypothetical protein [Vibrio sp. Isolate30]